MRVHFVYTVRSKVEEDIRVNKGGRSVEEIFSFKLLGLNMLQWALYIGIALCAMLIALILVKRR